MIILKLLINFSSNKIKPQDEISKFIIFHSTSTAGSKGDGGTNLTPTIRIGGKKLCTERSGRVRVGRPLPCSTTTTTTKKNKSLTLFKTRTVIG